MSAKASKKRKNRQMIAIPNKELYERAKTKALEKGLTLQAYVNTMLNLNIEKDEFLKHYAPHLSATVGEDSIYVKDSKRGGRTAEIVLRDGKLVCYLDEDSDCEHIKFAIALPEIARLHLNKV